MNEEKIVTIKDIEKEAVEFESGIWVFLAKNLYDLRIKMRKSLENGPMSENKKRNISKMRVKPTISKYN